MMNRTAHVLLPLMLALAPLAAEADAGIKAFTPDDMRRIEESNRGEPFVLMLWSLDCVYCKASLNTLSAESKRRKLRLVTVATDSADDLQVTAQLRQRLAQAGVRSQAWAFGDAPQEQLRYAIDPKWYGELPRSYWYDAAGRRTAYSGLIDDKVLAKLLPR